MDATKLLQWQYLIYLLPGGISALMLLLSSLRMGHRGGHGGGGHGTHGGHGTAGGHGLRMHSGPSGGGSSSAGRAGAHGGHTGQEAHVYAGGAPQHGASGRVHAGVPKVQARVGKVEVARHGVNRENMTVSTNLLLQITGADRAPVAMLLEAFCLVWGVCGYWAQRVHRTGGASQRRADAAVSGDRAWRRRDRRAHRGGSAGAVHAAGRVAGRCLATDCSD